MIKETLRSCWGENQSTLWAIRRWIIKNCQKCIFFRNTMTANLKLERATCQTTNWRQRQSKEEERWERKEGRIDGRGVRGRRSSHLQADRKAKRCHNPSLSVWGGETTLTSIYNPLALSPSISVTGLWHGVFIREGRVRTWNANPALPSLFLLTLTCRQIQNHTCDMMNLEE